MAVGAGAVIQLVKNYSRNLNLKASITVGIVGAPKLGTEARFDVNGVMVPGKRVMGIVEGDVVPQVFIPQLIDLHLQGRFPFDKLVKFYEFDQINEAIAESEAGRTIKPILRISSVA